MTARSPRVQNTPGGRVPPQWADLAACVGLAAVATIAAFALPGGSMLRLVLTVPILLFVPGYLLLQAMLVPAAPGPTRLTHGFYAIGVSPAVAGLLALSTSLIPGGFKPVSIIAILGCACLALAALAGYRRAANPVTAPASAADAVEGV